MDQDVILGCQINLVILLAPSFEFLNSIPGVGALLSVFYLVLLFPYSLLHAFRMLICLCLSGCLACGSRVYCSSLIMMFVG